MRQGRKTTRRTKPRPQTAAAERPERPAVQDMAERLRSLEPGTQRFIVLQSAIDFKRSWVHLAKHLAHVRNAGAYREWGYRTFEAYAQHELNLRRDTCQKLVRSYDFLNSHERPLLDKAERAPLPGDPSFDGGQLVPLPNYQALDILAEARQNPNLSEDDYKEIRDQVFRDDPAAAAVKKLVRERAPEAAAQKENDRNERLRKALNMAERLYGILLEEEVPEGIAHSVEQAVGGLRKLLGEP
ncbi:MAG: hypothetical protein AAF449_13650 [Myxococcota bacterium]